MSHDEEKLYFANRIAHERARIRKTKDLEKIREKLVTNLVTIEEELRQYEINWI